MYVCAKEISVHSGNRWTLAGKGGSVGERLFHSAANWITFPHVTWDNQFEWSVQEFAAVRRRTNEGIPTVLGLRRREGGPMGHQVLAYGYDANGWRLFVYDPNYPDVEKCLSLNHAAKRIEYDGEHSPQWSSYFVTGCAVEGGPPPS